MSYETINRQGIIDIFHELMQPDSPFRILRLLGESKLGKTHFLTKVFPTIARQHYSANFALLELRSRALTRLDILHIASGLLGDETTFPSYHAAYHDWMNRPHTQVAGLQALLSYVRIKPEGEPDQTHKATRHLVSRFVSDLRAVTDIPSLFLFDALDDAADISTVDWLMNVLLVQLAQLPHLRVVLAGQSVPEPCASYTTLCRTHELLPVDDEDEYIAYCRQLGIQLSCQSIRDIAHILDYKPGLFVDYVLPRYAHRESFYV